MKSHRVKKKISAGFQFMLGLIAGNVFENNIPALKFKTIGGFAMKIWYFIAPYIILFLYSAGILMLAYGIHYVINKTMQWFYAMFIAISAVIIIYKIFETIMKAKQLADAKKVSPN